MITRESIERKRAENLKHRIEKLGKEEQVFAVAQRKSNGGGGNGIPALLTLTWHDCGKRISLGRKVFAALGAPGDIQISVNKPFLIIRDGGGAGFQLSQTEKGKPILYNSEVVRQLIETFAIDLSVHSTHSYYEGEFMDDAYYILMGAEEETEATEFSPVGSSTDDSETEDEDILTKDGEEEPEEEEDDLSDLMD